ncbi:MAG: hypothetical protein OER96_02640 [Gammaproteobacteria bacterium]|nr:hypothetical protein [Gammaproteobacteria bacterium]
MTKISIDTEFYGLRGITHGGAKLLTVLSASGKDSINEVIVQRTDLMAYPGAGQLVQFHEKRSGALNALIERYNIRVLSKTEWDDKKKEVYAPEK